MDFIAASPSYRQLLVLFSLRLRPCCQILNFQNDYNSAQVSKRTLDDILNSVQFLYFLNKSKPRCSPKLPHLSKPCHISKSHSFYKHVKDSSIIHSLGQKWFYLTKRKQYELHIDTNSAAKINSFCYAYLLVLFSVIIVEKKPNDIPTN